MVLFLRTTTWEVLNLDLSITTAREMAGLETDQPQNGTGSSNSRSNSQVQADLSCSTRYKYDLAMLSGSRRILGLASHSGSLRRARCKSVRMAGSGIMMLIVWRIEDYTPPSIIAYTKSSQLVFVYWAWTYMTDLQGEVHWFNMVSNTILWCTHTWMLSLPNSLAKLWARARFAECPAENALNIEPPLILAVAPVNIKVPRFPSAFNGLALNSDMTACENAKAATVLFSRARWTSSGVTSRKGL